MSGGTSGGNSTTYPGDDLHPVSHAGPAQFLGRELWDYLVFNDRDFSSVAELLLVPGCPPGLFTKQFAEFAPSQINAANIFGLSRR